MNIIKTYIKSIYILIISVSVFLLTSLMSDSFDKLNKIEVQHKIERISNKILKFGLKDVDKSRFIASQIYEASNQYKLSPDLMVAILKVESSFDQNAVSKTGDISIAQINIKTWNKEFYRLKKKRINHDRLKKDSSYAIFLMAEILSTIRETNKKENEWYLFYHSKNPERKSVYSKKIKKYLKI